MSTYFTKLIAFFMVGAIVAAQTGLSLEDQLTSLWKERNYKKLGVVLDANASGKAPDVVALYCSKFFYVFIQPDKARALAAANKLKQLAEASGNADFVAFASGELAEVKSIRDSEFVPPTKEILAMFHKEFGEQYPNVEMGSRLKKITLH